MNDQANHPTSPNSPEERWEKALAHLGGSQYHREKHELLKFPRLLKNTGTFVDIGASLGPYTWMAHYSLANATLVSVEANPHLCEHTGKEWDKVVSAGETKGNTLKIVNAAIHDTEGSISFEIDSNNFLNSRISSEDSNPSTSGDSEVTEVKCVRLDGLFPDNDPDLIKLDVEGAEWRALSGGRKLLARAKCRFLVEIHPWGDSTIGKRPSDIFAIFREYGYNVTRYNQHWLFEPTGVSFKNRMTSMGYGFVLNNPWAKRLAKKFLASRKK